MSLKNSTNKLMKMLICTKKKPSFGMTRNLKERFHTGPKIFIVQVKVKSNLGEVEIKMVETIHSG